MKKDQPESQNIDTPTSEQPSAVPEAPDNNKKTLKLALAGVIVILLALVGWFVWKAVDDSNDSLNDANSAESSNINIQQNDTEDSPQDVDETATWKTYEDKEFGFSFKYPPNWTVNEDHTAEDPENGGFYNSPVVEDQNGEPVIIFNEGGVGCTEEVSSKDDFEIGDKKVTLSYSCFYLLDINTEKGMNSVLVSVGPDYSGMTDLKNLFKSMTGIISAEDGSHAE